MPLGEIESFPAILAQNDFAECNQPEKKAPETPCRNQELNLGHGEARVRIKQLLILAVHSSLFTVASSN